MNSFSNEQAHSHSLKNENYATICIRFCCALPRFRGTVMMPAALTLPSPHGIAPERAASQQRVAVTTQLAPRLPAAVGSAASEVMMLGSGEFVMLLLRCCLLLMLWLLMLLLLLRPRGRTGARPMRASSPSVGANSIISSRRNVLLGCTECAVRALSEKVRGGCVHSL